MEIKHFIREYVKALREDNAAILAGAGFSVSAGYVNWKELLKDVASELRLEVDKEEHDLVSLAQYFTNENSSGGRGRLNQIIVEHFSHKVNVTENHRILARLPIETYWTTNYDVLIEQSLREYGKIPDVKVDPANLAVTTISRDAVVYKMHGDVSNAHNAVITRDDYERYESDRHIFSTALRGDLVSKTFLFVGFSFNDPNLNYILSRIRISLENNQRPHYCILKKISRKDFDTDEDFVYAEVKQSLRINDLKRFAINTVLIDDYNEITSILSKIEQIYMQSSIFISGSAEEYATYGKDTAIDFIHNLSKTLVANNLKVVTGFGLGIGSAVINGALEEIHSSKFRHTEDKLLMFPFPQFKTGAKDLAAFWGDYRTEIMSNAGIALFVFGNKQVNGEIVLADGLMKEFDIAIQKGLKVIPIGATGYMAKELWNKIMDNFLNYYSNDYKPLFDKIGDTSTSLDEIIKTVVEIINKIRSI